MDCCCKDAKITLDELKKHDASSSNMWIAIHGNVYDISKFCQEHPGGSEVLRENAGRDASSQFDDVGHSKTAKEMLEKLKIGILITDPSQKKK